jgi:hypothetical protein
MSDTRQGGEGAAKTKTLRLTIDLTYEPAMIGEGKEEVDWFWSDVMGGELILHSNEIGDAVGTVKLVAPHPDAAPSPTAEATPDQWHPDSPANWVEDGTEPHPYYGEQRFHDLYKVNTTASWAQTQLRILSDMARDHKLPEWYADEVDRIRKGLFNVTQIEEERKHSACCATDSDHRIIDSTSVALRGCIGTDKDVETLIGKVAAKSSAHRERTLAEIAIAFIRWSQDLKRLAKRPTPSPTAEATRPQTLRDDVMGAILSAEAPSAAAAEVKWRIAQSVAALLDQRGVE